MMCKISILPEPEMFNGKPMYCWCILGQSGDNYFNCGHGRSESIAKAAEDAYVYYQEVLKKE